MRGNADLFTEGPVHAGEKAARGMSEEERAGRLHPQVGITGKKCPGKLYFHPEKRADEGSGKRKGCRR